MNPSGGVLYETALAIGSLGVPINDQSALHIKEAGMAQELVVTGEHVNDYIQFSYGETAWTTLDTEGVALCNLVGENWPAEGPRGCPSAAAVSFNPPLQTLFATLS